MCASVCYPGRRWIGSVAQLRAAGFQVLPEGHDPGWLDDSCLCGVDVEAVLERAGVGWVEDAPGFYDLATLPEAATDDGSMGR